MSAFNVVRMRVKPEFVDEFSATIATRTRSACPG